MNTFIQLVGIATLGDIDGLGTIVMQEKDWMQMYMYKYRSTIQGVLDKGMIYLYSAQYFFVL